MVPAALGSVVTEEGTAQALQCRALVEAANGPTTPGADRILQERGIPVVPDFLSNAGGVVVSYFEWTQNLQQLRWEIDEVRDRLERKMVSAYREVSTLAKKEGVNLRTAAYAIALRRVAEAEELRGN
jgi:glutamate dehydrogenase/leucine dehydrogenase